MSWQISSKKPPVELHSFRVIIRIVSDIFVQTAVKKRGGLSSYLWPLQRNPQNELGDIISEPHGKTQQFQKNDSNRLSHFCSETWAGMRV